MEAYEYKVVNLKADVTAGDVVKGIAGNKVATQVELNLKEYAQGGWEYYSIIPVEVRIKKGCLGDKNGPDSVSIHTMVFRRAVK